jgi:hypothetical protein
MKTQNSLLTVQPIAYNTLQPESYGKIPLGILLHVTLISSEMIKQRNPSDVANLNTPSLCLLGCHSALSSQSLKYLSATMSEEFSSGDAVMPH